MYNPGRLAVQGGEPPDRAVEMLREYLLLVKIEGIGCNAVEHGEFDTAMQTLHAAGYGQYVTDCMQYAPDATPAEVQHLLRGNLAHLRGAAGQHACDRMTAHKGHGG